MKVSNPKMTQAKLRDVAKAEYGVCPSMTQINRMLQSKDKFLNVNETVSDKKRERGAKWPALEKGLDDWLQQV